MKNARLAIIASGAAVSGATALLSRPDAKLTIGDGHSPDSPLLFKGIGAEAKRIPALAERLRRLWPEATGQPGPMPEPALELALGYAMSRSGIAEAGGGGWWTGSMAGSGNLGAIRDDGTESEAYAIVEYPTRKGSAIRLRYYRPGTIGGVKRSAADAAAYDFLRHITQWPAIEELSLGDVLGFALKQGDFGDTEEGRLSVGRAIASHVPMASRALGHRFMRARVAPRLLWFAPAPYYVDDIDEVIIVDDGAPTVEGTHSAIIGAIAGAIATVGLGLAAEHVIREHSHSKTNDIIGHLHRAGFDYVDPGSKPRDGWRSVDSGDPRLKEVLAYLGDRRDPFLRNMVERGFGFQHRSGIAVEGTAASIAISAGVVAAVAATGFAIAHFAGDKSKEVIAALQASGFDIVAPGANPRSGWVRVKPDDPRLRQALSFLGDKRDVMLRKIFDKGIGIQRKRAPIRIHAKHDAPTASARPLPPLDEDRGAISSLAVQAPHVTREPLQVAVPMPVWSPPATAPLPALEDERGPSLVRKMVSREDEPVTASYAATLAMNDAMGTDYLSADFAKAESKLRATIAGCTACDASTRARLYVALGTVLGGGKRDTAAAKDAFVEALRLDRSVAPDPDLVSSEVSAAFSLAKASLNISGAGNRGCGAGQYCEEGRRLACFYCNSEKGYARNSRLCSDCARPWFGPAPISGEADVKPEHAAATDAYMLAQSAAKVEGAGLIAAGAGVVAAGLVAGALAARALTRPKEELPAAPVVPPVSAIPAPVVVAPVAHVAPAQKQAPTSRPEKKGAADAQADLARAEAELADLYAQNASTDVISAKQSEVGALKGRLSAAKEGVFLPKPTLISGNEGTRIGRLLQALHFAGSLPRARIVAGSDELIWYVEPPVSDLTFVSKLTPADENPDIDALDAIAPNRMRATWPNPFGIDGAGAPCPCRVASAAPSVTWGQTSDDRVTQLDEVNPEAIAGYVELPEAGAAEMDTLAETLAAKYSSRLDIGDVASVVAGASGWRLFLYALLGVWVIGATGAAITRIIHGDRPLFDSDDAGKIRETIAKVTSKPVPMNETAINKALSVQGTRLGAKGDEPDDVDKALATGSDVADVATGLMQAVAAGKKIAERGMAKEDPRCRKTVKAYVEQHPILSQVLRMTQAGRDVRSLAGVPLDGIGDVGAFVDGRALAAMGAAPGTFPGVLERVNQLLDIGGPSYAEWYTEEAERLLASAFVGLGNASRADIDSFVDGYTDELFRQREARNWEGVPDDCSISPQEDRAVLGAMVADLGLSREQEDAIYTAASRTAATALDLYAPGAGQGASQAADAISSLITGRQMAPHAVAQARPHVAARPDASAQVRAELTAIKSTIAEYKARHPHIVKWTKPDLARLAGAESESTALASDTSRRMIES